MQFNGINNHPINSNIPESELPQKGTVAARSKTYLKLQKENTIAALSPKERFMSSLGKGRAVVLGLDESSSLGEESVSDKDLVQENPTLIRQSSDQELPTTAETVIQPKIVVQIAMPRAQGRLGRLATAIRSMVNMSSFKDVVRYFNALLQDENGLTTDRMLSERTNQALERMVIKTVPSGDARAAILTNLMYAQQAIHAGRQEEAINLTITAVESWADQPLKNSTHRRTNAIAIKELAVEWANSERHQANLAVHSAPNPDSTQAQIPQPEVATASTSQAPVKSWSELVAEHGGGDSKAIRNLRALGTLTIDQIIANADIRKNFIDIVRTTMFDEEKREKLITKLKKINNENRIKVLSSVLQALGAASAAFQVPKGFEELGMMKQRSIFIRQREINEAEEVCELINTGLIGSQKGFRDLLFSQTSKFVAKVNENSDNENKYNEYKTEESIQLLIELCNEVLPGAPGQFTRNSLQHELSRDIKERDVSNAMQAIGLALQNKGQSKLGTDLIEASFNVF